ncbi:NAD(P)/FAD-dependent oxidoreductase [Alkalihalobacillus sp. AL-G]|uniref:flavin-containing monooxygenase n=1 Tax=Alkalihalobacillus sp. AL-G TaxID=2926399 RepID=UPI0027298D90|nr:NAD(P)/FAD-dependent oxidoreductase [Alkalihalobacillus sp. AL-G]WLD94383.1 NAD(P)/FAD-dependent oxidoreductase [Alkalihalobacillus sp. AL-G]
MKREVDVLVIGAGQAGLAMGYFLKHTKKSFVLVDSSTRIGDVWRKRYDSLVLFSPRAYCSLPGLALTGDPQGFPVKDEIADYFESYAKHFSMPVHLNTKVSMLEQIGDKYIATTTQGDIQANKVVIATGPFQKPFVPKLEGTLSDQVFQIHSSEYRRPSQLPEGTTLVIGSGNSGSQIASELSNSRSVYLSTGHKLVCIPPKLLNRSLFWWLDATLLSKVPAGSKLAKRLQYEPVIGMEINQLIKSGKVLVKERAVLFDEHEVEFKDGTRVRVNSIVWATGFEFDYSWIKIPGVLDPQKKPIHQRGVSPVDGMYFLGLPWLSRVGSAQLNGIGHDAKYLFKNHLTKT